MGMVISPRAHCINPLPSLPGTSASNAPRHISNMPEKPTSNLPHILRCNKRELHVLEASPCKCMLALPDETTLVRSLGNLQTYQQRSCSHVVKPKREAEPTPLSRGSVESRAWAFVPWNAKALTPPTNAPSHDREPRSRDSSTPEEPDRTPFTCGFTSLKWVMVLLAYCPRQPVN